jgi:hypothetical protein
MKASRTVLSWLGLACILIGYIAFVARMHPINLFGLQQDDSIYFSSAKALAEGKGYILPSVPGNPPAANKFPILYPWMLSWVWRWNPSFPLNVNDGVALTVAFGLIYITFVFIFFHRSLKMGDAEALLLTAFCAFHPVILFRSASILSDIPFAALALGSLVIADTAMQRSGTATAAVTCGVLAGLATLARTTGYPVVFGILVIGGLHKAWRQAAVFSSITAAFFAFVVWEKLSVVKASLPTNWSTFSPAAHQTWLYYTDYLGFRKLSLVNLHVVGTIFLNQLLYLCAQLPGYFLWPFVARNILILFVLTVLLLWLMFAGFVQTIMLNGWKPIHVALLLYLALVLVWNYPDWDRFLIPFLPLLTASLWEEGKWIAAETSHRVLNERRGLSRIAALSFAVALTALTLTIGWNFVTNRDRTKLLSDSRARGQLLIEKRQAYDWLRRNAPKDSRIIAAEDGCSYLYTGRQSMGHISFLPVGIYYPEQLQSDLNHLTDVATAIKATYWLGSTDDSDSQWKGAKPQLAARVSEIEAVLPELFRSTSGNVRVYGLGCLQNRQDASCQSVEHVLFPEGR